MNSPSHFPLDPPKKKWILYRIFRTLDLAFLRSEIKFCNPLAWFDIVFDNDRWIKDSTIWISGLIKRERERDNRRGSLSPVDVCCTCKHDARCYLIFPLRGSRTRKDQTPFGFYAVLGTLSTQPIQMTSLQRIGMSLHEWLVRRSTWTRKKGGDHNACRMDDT